MTVAALYKRSHRSEACGTTPAPPLPNNKDNFIKTEGNKEGKEKTRKNVQYIEATLWHYNTLFVPFSTAPKELQNGLKPLMDTMNIMPVHGLELQ